MSALKDMIYHTIVPEGWGMSYKEPSIETLDKLITIATAMKKKKESEENK